MGYRYNSKPTDEDLNRLDLHGLHRKGFLEPGTSFTSSWSRMGRKYRTIEGYVTADGVYFSYTVQGEHIQYLVTFTFTECNYGGTRMWFVCPNRNCQRRVATLYGGKHFVCRHCYKMSYQSRNETDPFRLLRKAQKMRERLGGSGSTFDPIPDRPKGMHRTTYNKLRWKLQNTEQGMWGSMSPQMREWA